MDTQAGVLGSSLFRRLWWLVATTTVVLLACLLHGVPPAHAVVPEKTDIMFVLDTSGSMTYPLEEIKGELNALVSNSEATLPNVEFGIASVEDIPGYENGTMVSENIHGEPTPTSETGFEKDAEKPWALWQPLTNNAEAIANALNGLSGEEVKHFGGDGPEAYGRALYETATNQLVGWRPGAHHEIVLIADNVPHMPDANEGIPGALTNPETDRFDSWPDTGEEPEGQWGIPGTRWKTGESLEFHKVLTKLDIEEKPLLMVDYLHTKNPIQEEPWVYTPYWEVWAAATGGQAISNEEGSELLAEKLIPLILPPCPAGYERTARTPCVAIPAPGTTTTGTTGATGTTGTTGATGTTGTTGVLGTTSTSLSTAPPVRGKLIVLANGEIEEEGYLPEGGAGEDLALVEEGASLASVQAAKGCEKGFVRIHGKCVGDKPVAYGRVHFTATKAGHYMLRIKPSAAIAAALRRGKTLGVKLTLVFTPAGTSDHLRSVRYVTVHLKKEHNHK